MVYNYHLTHDRVRRDILSPQRYGYGYLICYDLEMVEGLQDLESITFRETFKINYNYR